MLSEAAFSPGGLWFDVRSFLDAGRSAHRAWLEVCALHDDGIGEADRWAAARREKVTAKRNWEAVFDE